jgi:hypothetical protein
MNSLSDILNQKADELFLNDTDATTEETKSDDTQIDTPEENDEKPLNIAELKNTIYKIKDQLDSMLRMMDGEIVKTATKQNPDGEKMVGSDGKEYSIPPNYASKSKLVEGDMMKLTITHNGSFIYKQIQPIERKRITGELVSDPTSGQSSVLADGRTYKVLTASVTFFKGKAGDEVVVLVPQDGESDWGAVENIINK